MKYYKCIREYVNSLNYITVDKYYREDHHGNDNFKTDRYCNIDDFIKSVGNSSHFREVTQLEYLKSINLKERLIKLAKEDKVRIKLNSRKEAKILDKLFLLIGHPWYLANQDNLNVLTKWWEQERNAVAFNYGDSISAMLTKDTTEITLKQLLDYV